MKNKEVIDKLQGYFLEKDPKVVSRICANFMIDLGRFLNFQQLTKAEQDHLLIRTTANIEQLKKFIKNGSGDDLKIINYPVNSSQKVQ